MHDPLRQGTEILISTTSDQVGHLHVRWTMPCTLYNEQMQSPPRKTKQKPGYGINYQHQIKKLQHKDSKIIHLV